MVRLAICSSSFLSSPRCSLSKIKCPTPSIFCCCSNSLPHLFRSHLPQSSHHILGLPRLLFPFTFWASALFANYSSPILSICPAHSNFSSRIYPYVFCFRCHARVAQYIYDLVNLSSPQTATEEISLAQHKNIIIYHRDTRWR